MADDDSVIASSVDKFAFHVEAQDSAESLDESDLHAAGIREAWHAVIAFGDKGREALTRLFTHEYPRVRVCAAACLLRYKHAEARQVLEREMKGSGLAALGAKCTLFNWETGRWQLDPAPETSEDEESSA